MLHRIRQPALLAARQVPQDQTRPLVVARTVDQPLPVRRQRRPKPGAVTRRARVRLPRLAVVDRQLVLGQVGVVGPVAGAAREPDVATVRAERRPHRLQPLGLLQQLHPRSAVHMEEVEPRQVAAAKVAHPGDDVTPVGRPLRRLGPVRLALAHLDRVLEVEGEDPDVLAAAAVGGEDDA